MPPHSQIDQSLQLPSGLRAKLQTAWCPNATIIDSSTHQRFKEARNEEKPFVAIVQNKDSAQMFEDMSATVIDYGSSTAHMAIRRKQNRDDYQLQETITTRRRKTKLTRYNINLFYTRLNCTAWIRDTKSKVHIFFFVDTLTSTFISTGCKTKHNHHDKLWAPWPINLKCRASSMSRIIKIYYTARTVCPIHPQNLMGPAAQICLPGWTYCRL